MIETLPITKEIKTLYSFDTEYSADSVEWCPHDPHKNIFVCANYQLVENSPENQESPCKRLGRILLFSISPTNELKLHQEIDTPAVLDQKWCHNQLENHSVLGVVNANNTLELYKLISDRLELELIDSCSVEKDDESEILLLSLDWSTGKFSSSEPEIVCSDSKGNLHKFCFRNNKLCLDFTWHGHDFEAWISAFDYWDPNVFFSGGDDCIFLKFDKRVGQLPVSRNRSHEAGVTSIHSNASREHILATGSYDSFVRLWDTRHLKSPINSIEMPGTLWRLKWDPFCHTRLLSACMLGGVHIIDAKTTNSMAIVESFYEHKNIAYGADWSHLNGEEVKRYTGANSEEKSGNVIIGTCSFYDHLLCVSQLSCDFMD